MKRLPSPAFALAFVALFVGLGGMSGHGLGGWRVELQNSTMNPISTAIYAICVPGTASFPNGLPPAF